LLIICLCLCVSVCLCSVTLHSVWNHEQSVDCVCCHLVRWSLLGSSHSDCGVDNLLVSWNNFGTMPVSGGCAAACRNASGCVYATWREANGECTGYTDCTTTPYNCTGLSGCQDHLFVLYQMVQTGEFFISTG
jgi:hypothetical protein